MTHTTRRNGNGEFIADLIARTRSVKGGHLFIGTSEYTLYCGQGRTLSGYDCDSMKASALAAGIPIIDARTADQDAFLSLVFNGPMIAVGEEPRFFMCNALSYESLPVMAARYHAIGATIHNIPETQEAGDDPLSLPT
ncbi:MAG: hypothetical protein PHT60_14025 [Acidiphilium sp.]|nr:hypothetical protein [Acidiphilium sp.]MDD4936883.1 hypothetical protein [Acidiphilium sp.]